MSNLGASESEHDDDDVDDDFTTIRESIDDLRREVRGLKSAVKALANIFDGEHFRQSVSHVNATLTSLHKACASSARRLEVINTYVEAHDDDDEEMPDEMKAALAHLAT